MEGDGDKRTTEIDSDSGDAKFDEERSVIESIRKELKLFTVANIEDVTVKAIVIDGKYLKSEKEDGKIKSGYKCRWKNEYKGEAKGEGSSSKEFHYNHCKVSRHLSDYYWKLHLKLRPKEEKSKKERSVLAIEVVDLPNVNKPLSLPTPIPVPPTFHGMSWEEVEEADDDFYQLWRFHYVVLFAAHRRSCLRMLAEDPVLAEDEKAGKSSKKYCRYPVKDWSHVVANLNTCYHQWNLVGAFKNALDKLAKEDARAVDIETIPRGEESYPFCYCIESIIMVEERDRRDNRTRYTKNHYEGKRKGVSVRRDNVDTCPEEPSYQKPRGNIKAFLPSSLKPQSVADRGKNISRERKSSNFECSPPVLCDLTKKNKVLSSEMRSKNPKPSSKFDVYASNAESSSSDRTMDDSVVISTVNADNPSVSSGRDVGLHVGDKTGQLFKYPENVPSLDRWKRSMDIGNDIDIVYYNGTGSEVVEEGFLCYLNQVAYGLSIPLTFFQKGVMNALKSCLGQLNGNIFEMMRVCEVLNQKWRDGGIARQFVTGNLLKYYKFKYVKDRKSGYLFSDSARPKFFDFESSGRPWRDHHVMVRGNCMQVPREPALELIYKNFNKKPNPKVVVDTSSLFDIISREGSELNKVLGELGICREKRLNYVVEKVERAHQKLVMAASGSAYADVIDIPSSVVATSSSLVWRPRMKKTVPPSKQTASVQIPLVGTEGVVVDVDMAPPLKKQKKESGKDIRASSKGVNLEAEEQEALDLATHDPIRLDTQIRSSISQFEQEKVLQREQFEKEVAATKQEVKDEEKKAVDIAVASQNKLIQAFYVWGLSREDVDLALTGRYGKIVFPGEDTSPVAEQTPAPLMDNDPTNKEVVHLRGKVIEMEKALSRARDSINHTQQGQRAIRILFFNIKREDRKIHAQLEIDLRHACDELERCKGHNASLETEKVECTRLLQNSEKRVTLLEVHLIDTQQRLQVSQSRLKKKITPKRGKRAADTDHERQMADVIVFYGAELKRVENEFRHYISSCGKDVEVENDKVENMWFTEGDEGGGASTSKPRAEESEEEEVKDLLPHTRHKTRPQEECIQGNKDFKELHAKYKESQRMMDAAEAEINYSREVDNKLHRLKQEMKRSVQITKQYRGSLLQEKKSLEAQCKDLDDELNKVKTEFYEAILLIAENVTLRVMAMLHADVEKF
ncbi:hypothetical protein GIB67_013063 [Kingdonia uniflora]|uniref:Uncharacterized protein n=1 Tax=Kingdonia uniflora TaxID=39325 RepID=A0A7J7MCI7_9MAGN|nr:hypothetical protein GIB67_013063 [Kingdonia uniflora]